MSEDGKDKKPGLYECNVTFYVVALSQDDAYGEAERLTDESLSIEVEQATAIRASWSDSHPFVAEPDFGGFGDSIYAMTCKDWINLQNTQRG